MNKPQPGIAYVNHGRWVVECECATGHHVPPFTPHIECACGRRITPTWPQGLSAIEAVLDQRPFRDTRNWWPWETVEQLMTENTEQMRN